jgi:hypothetical protein
MSGGDYGCAILWHPAVPRRARVPRGVGQAAGRPLRAAHPCVCVMMISGIITWHHARGVAQACSLATSSGSSGTCWSVMRGWPASRSVAVAYTYYQ